ncbi:HD domain-containing protein [Streptomyces sp. SYSU K21746]
MSLLDACRGVRDAPGHSGGPVDLHDHVLRTAHLLRRSHPADKELQVAGLVHGLGEVLHPGDGPGHAHHAADAVRALLGARVARLVELHAALHAEPYAPDVPAAAFRDDPHAEAALTLRQADEAAKTVGPENAGVMEDWRPVLELVSAAAGSAGYQAAGA